MATTWTAASSGTPDADDPDTAIATIDTENARRTAENDRRTAEAAAEEPPGTPTLLSLLPKATGPQIKASIEVILAKELNDLWVGKKQLVQKDQGGITQVQKDAILGNLTRRRRAGETWEQLVTDTAA